jgi:hypothetical protein
VDTFDVAQDEGVAYEGVMPGEEHPPTPLAVENVVERKYGRTRRPTQRFAESQHQLADRIVSYFTAHESINPKLYQEDLVLKGNSQSRHLVSSRGNESS